MIDNDRIGEVEGAEVVGVDGAALGRVRRVFRDDDTGHLEWAVVDVGGESSFVPLADAETDETGLRVPYTAEQVSTAPRVDADAGHVSRGQEADLYLHYGIDYDVSRLVQDRTTGLGAGGDPIGPSSDSQPAQGSAPMTEQTSGDTSVDADHEVRRGALDEGTERRSPEIAGTQGGAAHGADTGVGAGFGGAATMGTGAGGSAMGNASTRSAAGTNANTDLAARDDLLTTTGSERSGGGGDVTGDSMIDFARDPGDSGVADVGPDHSDVQPAESAPSEDDDQATGRDRR
jgi:hypothetical protein